MTESLNTIEVVSPYQICYDVVVAFNMSANCDDL